MSSGRPVIPKLTLVHNMPWTTWGKERVPQMLFRFPLQHIIAIDRNKHKSKICSPEYAIFFCWRISFQMFYGLLHMYKHGCPTRTLNIRTSRCADTAPRETVCEAPATFEEAVRISAHPNGYINQFSADRINKRSGYIRCSVLLGWQFTMLHWYQQLVCEI